MLCHVLWRRRLGRDPLAGLGVRVKLFHISDVLTVTTHRFVSSRGVHGIYDTLNFLTGDNLMTHQLPRASRQCDAWLREQYPQLMPDSQEMAKMLEQLDKLEVKTKSTMREWVMEVMVQFGLPEMLPLNPMPSGRYTSIDPIAEACTMFGASTVVAVAAPDRDEYR